MAPHKWPKGRQERSQVLPRAAKSAPRGAQERPKSDPRAAQELPRAPQQRPRALEEQPTVPQEHPKSSNERVKSSQEHPKSGTRAAKSAATKLEEGFGVSWMPSWGPKVWFFAWLYKDIVNIMFSKNNVANHMMDRT